MASLVSWQETDMSNRWLAIGVPIWIISSAAIAYALVFLTPWFREYEYSGGSYSVGIDYSTRPKYDHVGTLTPGSVEVYLDDFRELAKRQPAEVQKVVKELWGDLLKMSEPDLYI